MKIIITENQLKTIIENSVYQQFDYSDALKLEKALVKEYGTTDNYKLAGYITPNGYLIDLSEGQRQRTIDHRNIGHLFDEIGIDMGKYNEDRWKESFSKGLLAALDMGFIRYMPESDGFNFRMIPTQQQFEVMRRIITRKNGYVVIDLDDENGYAEYERGTPTDFIIDGIKNFFNRGEKLTTYEDAYNDEDLMEDKKNF